MKLNKKKIKAIKDLLTPTYPRIIKSLEEENEELRKTLSIEISKSKIREKYLEEVKVDNSRLAKEVENHINQQGKAYKIP